MICSANLFKFSDIFYEGVNHINFLKRSVNFSYSSDMIFIVNQINI